MNSLEALLRVALAVSAACMSAHSPAVVEQKPEPTKTRCVTVTVHDARTGLPVRDAPVQLIGSDEIGSTDINGQVNLLRIPTGPMIRAWSQPKGFTADVRGTPNVGDWNGIELFVMDEALLHSSTIAAVDGGNYTFEFDFGANHVWLNVQVPPGTFSKDVMFGLTPFPVSCMGDLSADEAPIAKAQISLLDSAGHIVQLSAAHPVTITLKPWAFSGVDLAAIDVADLKLRMLDPTTHAFTPEAQRVTVSSARDTLSFALTDWRKRNHWFMTLDHLSRLAHVDRAPPPSTPPTHRGK